MRSSLALVEASAISGVCGVAGVMEAVVEAAGARATDVIGGCVTNCVFGIVIA